MSAGRTLSRILLLSCALLCAGGVSKAFAQKTAPLVTRDSDHDGVPDTRDRCRNTPIGTHVDANGCPVAAPAPASAPVPAPAPAAAPPAAPAAVTNQAVTPPASQVAANQPATHPAPPPAPPPAPAPSAVPVSPPAAIIPVPTGGTSHPAPAPTPPPAPPPPAPAPRPAAVAVTDPTMTAGFWMPAYNGRTDADKLDYARTIVLKLDSAIVAMVDVFRNTSGVPLSGATGPTVLSAREKGRWTRCRLISLDLGTISEAVGTIKDSLPGGATLQRAAANLAEQFEGMVATSECDNIGSMIEAPDRWAPWQTNYETSARNFYKDWYTQLRAVHEADRGFARSLLPALPAARQFPVPAGLPPTPPIVGAGR